MYVTADNTGYIKVGFHSDLEKVNGYNGADRIRRVAHPSNLGGYRYPILDWVSDLLGGSHYRILRAERPADANEKAQLQEALDDPRTLYSYPDGHQVTVVQFSNWDNTTQSMADLGMDIQFSPKIFKRIKTVNRPFRAYSRREGPVRVLIVADEDYCGVADYFSAEDRGKLLDGAFVLSPQVVAECMAPFDSGVSVFDENAAFSCEAFNRNTEVRDYYQNSKIFNTRIFGPIHVINEGDPAEYAPYVGHIKGQGFVDHSGLCEYYDVDVICPYSAFKLEFNITSCSFFLLEPQSAKLGQMFSDGQTIANLPALYEWKGMRDHLNAWYDTQLSDLVNDRIMDQWADMSAAMFWGNNGYKLFDEQDVNSLSQWNVRAWIACGGSLTHSPWLFSQMGKNIITSMQIESTRRMRFPVPCAARAQVISESLLRAVKGVAPEDFYVAVGTARWDKDLSVLVVSDLDYVEMYPSHGGCDHDDFFQIYWRTMDDVRKIVVVRSPNDWGEYSIFDYVPGDWFKITTYGQTKVSFPTCDTDASLWPKRLSEALRDGDITYEGLPRAEVNFTSTEFNGAFVMEAIEASADAAACVGINVNGRQLWAASALGHRTKQLCSMEDCIDTGVQGGTEDQIQAVTDEGRNIVTDMISAGHPIDQYLWNSKHAFYNKDLEPELVKGNMTYLNAVRHKMTEVFQEKYNAYAEKIPANWNMTTVHQLGQVYLNTGISLLRQYRRSIAEMNQTTWDKETEGVRAYDWLDLSDSLRHYISTREEGHERNSLMLSLYVAAMKVPTRTGKITDQVVMQPAIFPFLMEALQFYGQLGRLVTDDGNRLQRVYDLPVEVYDPVAAKLVVFEDPVAWQKWYFEVYKTHVQEQENAKHAE